MKIAILNGSPKTGNTAVMIDAFATYKSILAFTGIEDAGIITAAGDENGSAAKLSEIRAFAKAL